MKLNIKVTKEILKKSTNCYSVGDIIYSEGSNFDSSRLPANNCAIALAVREIFPNAIVRTNKIEVGYHIILLPKIAREFIIEFDYSIPEERFMIKPIEFQVELSNKLINEIDISSLDLSKSKTLELVEL